MALTLDTRVGINNDSFTLREFLLNPNKYSNVLNSNLSRFVRTRKDNELDLDFYVRLFNSLLKKASGSTSSNGTVVRRTLDATARGILAKLGIDVIKYNQKTSNVVFKNSGNSYKMKNDSIDNIIKAIKEDTKYTRQKKSVLIGVELEFLGDYSYSAFAMEMNNLVGADNFSTPLRYNHNDGSKWVLGTDGSIVCHRSGKRGYELTSPKLNPSNKKDMDTLYKVIELIKEKLHGEVNKSCGTHIHMSFDTKQAVSLNMCKFLAKSYTNNESTLFDVVVPKTRTNSRWCARCSVLDPFRSRYQKINFLHIDRNGNDRHNGLITDDLHRMHLEFRQLNGTLDYDVIQAWIKLQKLFIEISLKHFDCNKPIEEQTVPTLKVENVIFDSSFNAEDFEAVLKMNAAIR